VVELLPNTSPLKKSKFIKLDGMIGTKSHMNYNSLVALGMLVVPNLVAAAAASEIMPEVEPLAVVVVMAIMLEVVASEVMLEVANLVAAAASEIMPEVGPLAVVALEITPEVAFLAKRKKHKRNQKKKLLTLMQASKRRKGPKVMVKIEIYDTFCFVIEYWVKKR